jgi:tetratricopeptide (TPR) repeat protein
MAKNDEAARRILTAVRQAVQKNPKDNGLREILASMYMRLRQFEQAFEIYRSLKGNWYLQNFAKEAGLAGAYTYAAKAYRLALQNERNPKRINDLRYLLAQSCFHKAQKQRPASGSEAEESVRCAEEQLKRLTEEQNDKRNRWRALVLLGDMQNSFYKNKERALHFYHKVEQEAPAGRIRAKTLLKIAEIELRQNRLDAAEKEYATIRYATERPFALYEWAKLDYYRGYFSKAVQRLSALQTQLQPQDTLTNNVLESLSFIQRYRQDSLALTRYAAAELLERRQQWERAAKAFGSLVQTGHTLALPALERATQIYLGHKQASEAFVLLNGFLQRNPQHPESDRVLLLLGGTYEKMNKPQQALNVYLTLIRSYPDSFYLEEARQQARVLKENTGQNLRN